ncbi:GAF and ANTAR domain-containing protein [Curtobacterium sp. MCLR17_007]|uniref:GAF and ANTAR domain-containing protein n=1 Tax=Curtobacterium sp. MCLR17_007 TaxID=2175648 RepID=UPI0011B5AC2F|nr:GAF and ANTAR domain-containing protein [Curtobacterium sp. MCLR17_007]WIB61910.1 GAF and ANTAR domain-containing protein [Curtobacterium sp. MCLR17_007]
MTALYRAGEQDDLCAPFLAAFPVDSVAISTLGDPLGSETVGASDDSAARWDEIQLDLGEGPCWEALDRGAPVLVPDLQDTETVRWPLALHALRATQLGAVFAFPMHVGPIPVGAVDLFGRASVSLRPSVVEDAVTMTGLVARHVLHRALVRTERAEEGTWNTGSSSGRYSRREVHQASGMIAAQTGAGAADSLLLLRAFAHTAGRPVLELAADVIAGRVDFTDHDEHE